MRKLFFLIGMMNMSNSFGQSMDKAAVYRIADYGKLWCVLNLFHPGMAYNKINADSLFTDNIGGLLEEPSAANFKNAVTRMIGRLRDPYTAVEDTSKILGDSVQLPGRPLLKWVRDSTALVCFSNRFIKENGSDNGTDTSLLRLLDTLRNARAIIIDLRKASGDDPEGYYEFVEKLFSYLTGGDLSYPSFRTRIHYGHESETFMSSYYYQGWLLRNTSVFIRKRQNSVLKPVCLLINRFNADISYAITAMQQGGSGLVIAADSLGDKFEPTSTYQMQLADNIKVNIRTSDVTYPNGNKTFSPDNVMPNMDFTTDDSLVSIALLSLRSGNEIKARPVELLPNIFVTGKVEGYDSLAYPNPALRLLGLMRYWSAINYFCPNKDRITKNWDSVLYEYVPKLLQAKDSLDYTYTVARLITEIHDGHGWFASKIWTKLYGSIPQLQLKYIENKTIVLRIYNDSLKKVLAPGDEIIKVDGIEVNILRNKLAKYIGASNNASLQRDVSEYLLSGEGSSMVKIAVLHNGAIKNLALHRNAKIYSYVFGPTTPEGERAWKKLNDKTGYVDFGKLTESQIDSMFHDFRNTDAIIIDDRSYPKGTAWTLINYLTDKTVTGATGTTMIADSPDPLNATMQNSLWQIPVTPKFQYKGRIIILVNEITQSQAEYSCMILQAACKKVTIIGSQTAGADGDVTGIKIPGGIQTAFSGHAVHYPDGRATQGIGIIPDIKITATIKGIKQGRDEVLERAIQFIKTGK